MSVQRALATLLSAPFRPALPCALAVAHVQSDSGVSFARARARCGFSRGHLLDIVVYLPGGTRAGHEVAAGEELVELLLGEELFERWVGSVSVSPAVRGGPLTVLNTNSEGAAALPLETLVESVHAAITGLKLGLPALPPPIARDSEEWVLFELEPEPAADYAAQDDLVLCTTRTPELKKSYLRGEPFFSGRFCSSHTLFAYLKYESTLSALDARMKERAHFEDALASALDSTQSALVGLGLGIRYGYLDIALLDVECFSERLCPALRSAGMPLRAWLLFFDSELDHEFVPVHASSPPPYFSER